MDGVDETIFGENRKTENRTFSANFEEVVHLRVITGDEGWQSGAVNHRRPDVWLLPGDGAGPKFESLEPMLADRSLSHGWAYIKFN